MEEILILRAVYPHQHTRPLEAKRKNKQFHSDFTSDSLSPRTPPPTPPAVVLGCLGGNHKGSFSNIKRRNENSNFSSIRCENVIIHFCLENINKHHEKAGRKESEFGFLGKGRFQGHVVAREN